MKPARPLVVLLLALTVLCSPPAVHAAGTATANAPTPHWQRSGHLWSLHVQGGDRTRIAAALAAASGTEVRGDWQALAAAPLPRWHLQALPLAQAWRAVLGPNTDHALQCDAAGRCRLWLLTPAAASSRPAAAAVQGSPPRQRAEAAVATVPTASADVVDPVVADPREPDPPGLFPSD